MHILELVIMIVVCGGSAVAARVVTRRRPRLRYMFIAAGFVLLGLNLISQLMTEHFYFLFPESFFTELLYGCSFLLVGVMSAFYLDTSSRRVIFLVFLVVLSYFTLADQVYFAVAAGKVRSLDGRVRDGVTIQSTGFSCVPASLATVLRLWGLEYTEGEIAYALRSSFRGTSTPKVPGAVSKLGAVRKLQAKVIRTTWEELLKFDVPCLLSTEYGRRLGHCSALIGLDEEWVIAGEPLVGLLRMQRMGYVREWRWEGRAVVIAPDFLHDFSPADHTKRCDQLFESLKSLGYGGRDAETVKQFQAEQGLEASGRLDWRTILVIEALTRPAARPRLSAFAAMRKEQLSK